MKQYQDLLRHILDHGEDRLDRTGTGTRSVFGYQMRFDLSEGFPLLTTKKMHLKGIIVELLWFLRGESSVEFLQEHGVTIWDSWAEAADGELGPIYGVQWRGRNANSIYADPGMPDQIADVIDQIKRNPESRRLIVSAWDVKRIPDMALPPCHLLFQFYVRNGGKLDCQLYQRSGDTPIGIPYNIASYALLTMMVAQVTGLQPGEFIHTIGDAHIYQNQMEGVKKQLEREPRTLPKMRLNPEVKSIDDFTLADFELTDYTPHPAIKMPVSV